MSIFRFEKGTNLPSSRCRSLVFVTNNSLFCVSGLTESRDENGNKKIKISNVSIIFIRLTAVNFYCISVYTKGYSKMGRRYIKMDSYFTNTST